MKRYLVTWFSEKVLKKKIYRAKNIDDVKWLEILPEEEKKRYAVSIAHCIGVSLVEKGKKQIYDYGSHTKFVSVEIIKKKAKIIWYIGTIDGTKVKKILNIKELRPAKWYKILPRKLRASSKRYYRILEFTDEIKVIDYGDAARFVRIQKW